MDTQYGMTAEQLKQLKDLFTSFSQIDEVIIYGSRAKGTNATFSDVDIALKGEALTDESLSNLTFAIDDLLLPYQFDISIYSKIRNEEVVKQIDLTGKVLYRRESEWKRVRLGDVCTITSSKRIFAKEYVDDGVPFFRGKEIIEKQKGKKVSTDLFIPTERYNEIKSKFGVPEEGDILLTSVGTLGIPWITDDKPFYFKDGNLTWLRSFKNIYNRYLYYWILSPRCKDQISQRSIGSTQSALTIETLTKFEIDLPPLSEQKQIAKILGSLDDKIELNNKINKNLEEQASALFKHWFVDFEFPNEKGQPYKSSGGEMVESEMGLIPKGWKVGALSDIADIIMGQSPVGTSYNELGQGEVFYQGRGEFGWRYPTKRMFTTEPKRIAVSNSILMSVRAPVGDINVAFENCCIGRGLACVLSPNGNNSFLLYQLKVLKVILDKFNAEGTVFGSINKNDLAAINVIISAAEIVSNFQQIVVELDSQIQTLHKEIISLTELRDSLLPKLVNNEIKLSEYE